MRTLYVSDLDGTLLQSNEKLSEYTSDTINTLVSKGMLFSYATARSIITAKKVTKGLSAKIPLIVYNGAFIIDNVTEKVLYANYFDDSVNDILEHFFSQNIYPIVYGMIGGKEKFSFVPKLCTKGMNTFINSRKGDIRTNPIDDYNDLKKGNIFYISCIDETEKLAPMYEAYKRDYHCVFQKDIYTGDQWLEILPKTASKANAVKRLKEMLGCNRVVAFGDGKNDINMFEAADESYAVSNAHEDLKKVATGVILSNNEDGVAKWLENELNS